MVKSIPAPTLKPDDSWVYDRLIQHGIRGTSEDGEDLKLERIGTTTMVVGIKPDDLPGPYQDHISGLDWSQRRIVDGLETITGRPFVFPLREGKTWTADYVEPRPHGRQMFAHFKTSYKVVGWEDVVVPAGTFHALKIVANGTADANLASVVRAVSRGVDTPDGPARVTNVARAPAGIAHAITYSEFYYAPEVKYFVKSMEEQYNSDNVLTSRDTRSLVSFAAQP